MCRIMRNLLILATTAGSVAVAMLLWSPWPLAHGAEAAAPKPAATLEQPVWQIGDNWIIETLTDRIQGREAKPAGKPARIRWEFRVTKLEKIGGHECFRLDVQCQAQGRIQPQSTVWCDKDTLFLRQFQTQLAFDGRYRTVQESFECPKGDYSPVLASVNALPLGMPAFVPKGAKATGAFNYTSQPLPAGAKDTSVIRFAHTVTQDILPPGSKSLEQAPRNYAKDLNTKPMTEVRLADHQQQVVQLWQKGVPWPVYAQNGRTQAWLVSAGRP